MRDISMREFRNLQHRVYLSCESCRGRLYEIDKDKLRAPVTGGMFLPVAGVGVCWHDRYGQDEMRCPRCGFAPMRTWNNLTVEYGDGQMGRISLEASRPIMLENGNAECPYCGIELKKRGIKTHMRYCKESEHARE